MKCGAFETRYFDSRIRRPQLRHRMVHLGRVVREWRALVPERLHLIGGVLASADDHNLVTDLEQRSQRRRWFPLMLLKAAPGVVEDEKCVVHVRRDTMSLAVSDRDRWMDSCGFESHLFGQEINVGYAVQTTDPDECSGVDKSCTGVARREFGAHDVQNPVGFLITQFTEAEKREHSFSLGAEQFYDGAAIDRLGERAEGHVFR